jgi:hypothetical protein
VNLTSGQGGYDGAGADGGQEVSPFVTPGFKTEEGSNGTQEENKYTRYPRLGQPSTTTNASPYYFAIGSVVCTCMSMHLYIYEYVFVHI